MLFEFHKAADAITIRLKLNPWLWTLIFVLVP